MVRFQVVKDTLAQLRDIEYATLRLADLISAANESLLGGEKRSSSGKVLGSKPFDDEEVAGHLTALETDSNIMFVKRRGIVYLIWIIFGTNPEFNELHVYMLQMYIFY